MFFIVEYLEFKGTRENCATYASSCVISTGNYVCSDHGTGKSWQLKK